ncbi:MAG: glycosyltransferase [Verrucomicrobia bacterium]|nr:glycosyltransferase [Verrucomicrobiota bacterium]
MIYYDVTKSAAAKHRSGLVRVNRRLREALGDAVRESTGLADAIAAGPGDWWLTTELFSTEERPGLGDFLRTRRCRAGAVFYDAIPLKLPQITWPQSVARHPGYMKLLAQFDRVWAISQASKDELLEYWRWLGLAEVPPVDVLPLGADLGATPRVTTPRRSEGTPLLLCVGIVEPRKNQTLLLDVCEELWGEGLNFELRVLGRVNVHFGAPIAARMKTLAKKYPQLRHIEGAGDAELAASYASARVTVCPTIAEGCGLPLLESLWAGVPCVGSDLPALLENASGGGCLSVTAGDKAAWKAALRRVLTDDALVARLAEEARTRELPTWAGTAAVLREGILRH